MEQKDSTAATIEEGKDSKAQEQIISEWVSGPPPNRIAVGIRRLCEEQKPDGAPAVYLFFWGTNHDFTQRKQ